MWSLSFSSSIYFEIHRSITIHEKSSLINNSLHRFRLERLLVFSCIRRKAGLSATPIIIKLCWVGVFWEAGDGRILNLIRQTLPVLFFLAFFDLWVFIGSESPTNPRISSRLHSRNTPPGFRPTANTKNSFRIGSIKMLTLRESFRVAIK